MVWSVLAFDTLFRARAHSVSIIFSWNRLDCLWFATTYSMLEYGGTVCIVFS